MSEPKIIFDADYLSEKQLQLGVERIDLCLSPIVFSILAEMNRMLVWDTRWRGGEDNIDRLMWLAWDELNNPRNCRGDEPEPEELIPPPPSWWLVYENQRLRDCIAKLESAIMCILCGSNCVGGSQQSEQQEIIEQLEELTEILQPVNCEDVGTIDETKCADVNYWFDAVLAFFDTLMDYASAQSLTVSAVVRLVTEAVWSRSVSPLVYALSQAIVSALAGSSLQVAAAWLANNRDAVVAAVYASTSPGAAQTAVMNMVSQSNLPAGARAVLWGVFNVVDWNGIFNGSHPAPAGYTPVNPCQSVPDLTPPPSYVLDPWTIQEVNGDYNEAVGQQSYTDNVAEMRLDQLQSGGYLDGTSYANMDLSEANETGVTAAVAAAFVFENYESNGLDSSLVLSDQAGNVVSVEQSLTGRSGTFQVRCYVTGADQAVIDWCNEADIVVPDYDRVNDNRLGLRNVDQSQDCVVSCRVSMYLLKEPDF